MLRHALLPMLAAGLIVGGAFAQDGNGGGSSQISSGSSSDPTTSVALCDECTIPKRKKIRAGDKFSDADGTSVSVDAGGTPSSGGVQVTYTGSATENPRGSGCWVTDGDITRIENPRSGGTTGPIVVDTGGDPVTIDLNKNGNPGNGTTVTGGNATVNLNNHNNNVSIDGGNPAPPGVPNTINVNGSAGNNTTAGGSGGTPGNPTPGSGSSSGGTVNYNGSGRGNSHSSNGGNWTTRT